LDESCTSNPKSQIGPAIEPELDVHFGRAVGADSKKADEMIGD
jgi:hypothetical protein